MKTGIPRLGRGVGWGEGNTTDEQRELNHFSTWGMRILWQKLMFFWLVLPLAWSEAGSQCSMEWRNNFALWLCLCSSDSVPEIRELRRRIGGAALPFRLFLLTWAFPGLYERWCLFLLACPRRRWATDFTHFYWLIWLCSCQQLRVSQESENLGNSSTAAASVAVLWLRLPGGRLSPVS